MKSPPRIKAVTSHFKVVGSEDHEEVAQDAIALAAKMLHNTEVHQKTVTAGNIAYCSIQQAKSGRGSVEYSNADAPATATQVSNLAVSSAPPDTLKGGHRTRRGRAVTARLWGAAGTYFTSRKP
jgi:hypothetical protein